MYHRLLVVVSDDEARGGRFIAEGLGIRRVIVGEKLGEVLMEVPAERRPLKVPGLLGALVDAVKDARVLLDHTEILFEASLKVDPLTLLKNLSRRRLVVAMWSGDIEAGNIVYGCPGHPEYRSYPARDVAVVRLP